MSDKGNQTLQKLLSHTPEGVFLAGITGLGYFSSYLSDLGYKTHFGIPSMFVEIHLTSVVLSICVIIFTLFIAALCITIPQFRKYGPHLFAVLIPLMIAVIVGMKLNFSLNREYFLTVVFLFLFHAVLLFIFFHLAQKQKRITNLIAVVLLALMMVSVSYSSGSMIAKNREHFLVSNQGQPLVVVDTYKDSLVVAPLERENSRIRPAYRFVHLESDLNGKLSFSRQEVGPLTIHR
ncbi:MAG: hypothetical protein M0Z65_09090 [Firmicutes bacterium]|uniref:Uncharacterized protein n=1 Tax=Melghirimyces thermohalophilus TaxID=1236220 RepID=A0A1G6KWF6_9BACL|nr:hypothetical protein [Melghirimyces thermohalophilus]MDA8353319.1 hypothetical protein [Bacillota bacterium]SDC34795.1 hypothetical protein SAMN04488112_106174 [Melghirimyces thermohalophilus]